MQVELTPQEVEALLGMLEVIPARGKESMLVALALIAKLEAAKGK